MKKFSKLLVVLVILIAIAILSIRYAPIYIIDLFDSKAEIKNESFDCEYLTIEETTTLKNIVCNKWCFYDGDEYMCGFFDGFSFKIGNNIFMPAYDGCPIIKVNNRYIDITAEERSKIDFIFKKYSKEA